MRTICLLTFCLCSMVIMAIQCCAIFWLSSNVSCITIYQGYVQRQWYIPRSPKNFGSRVWFGCSFFKLTTWSSRNRSTSRPLLQLGNAVLIFVTLPLNRMRVRPRHRGHARSQSYDSSRIRKSGFKESCRQLVLVDTSFAGFAVYWPSLVWFWQ